MIDDGSYVNWDERARKLREKMEHITSNHDLIKAGGATSPTAKSCDFVGRLPLQFVQKWKKNEEIKRKQFVDKIRVDLHTFSADNKLLLELLT